MATLSLVGEALPDWEAPQHLAAAEDLVRALGEAAPRSCSTRMLLAKDRHSPAFASPRIAVEHLPMRATALPLLWQSGTAARPLDGEMTHAITPLMPLRSRPEDDGTQSSLTVPNGIPWQAPELLSPAQLRVVRAYMKRAVRHADIIITSSHAMATLLVNHYGPDLPVQVIPPVAPTVMLEAADSAERRARLGLPGRYLVTTANNDQFGRLEWVLNALAADPLLPQLVVLTGLDPQPHVKGQPQTVTGPENIPAELRERVAFVSAADLSDAGAVISGATLFLQPQSFATTGYSVVAALMSGVPVLHAGTPETTELVVDAGAVETEAALFAATLSRLFITHAGDAPSELQRLAVFAADRGRSFSWESAAWQLWETHAAL